MINQLHNISTVLDSHINQSNAYIHAPPSPPPQQIHPPSHAQVKFHSSYYHEEEDDDMEVNIKEDKNELELTYRYEEVDPHNPPPSTLESEPEDMIELEDTIESEDETIPASVHEVGESSTAPFLREDSDALLPGLMRRDINFLFVRSSVEQGTTAMEKLVEKLGNVEEKAECKKLKKELKEARFSNTFLQEKSPSSEPRGSPNEAIDVLVKDEKSPSSEPRGSPNEAIDVLVKDEKSPSSEPRGSPHDA
ncbi:hypothetical protein Tco_0363644 [Tanacetum coccineum]